jgi:sialate O-acetylesterase
VYFNGVKIHEVKDVSYHKVEYVVSGTLVKAGKALLAMRIFTDQKVGNFNGVFKIGPKSTNPIALRTDRCRYQAIGANEKNNVEIITEPGGIPMGPDHPQAPASLFNSKIHPLVPYAIRGCLWYQGESNVDRAFQYRKLLPSMIKNWRDNWGQGDFPFLIVQLTSYGSSRPQPSDSTWAELREVQSLTASSVPSVGLAVIIDIGDAVDVHPKNKQDVGKRLALLARKISYGENLVCSGPTYHSMTVEGDKIRLRFENTDSGLSDKNGKLGAFAISGNDRKFVWSEAKIDGNDILLWSDKVKNPIAIRYAWADNPTTRGLLFNREGLPAAPFRTDNWPGITDNAK